MFATTVLDSLIDGILNVAAWVPIVAVPAKKRTPVMIPKLNFFYPS